MNQRASWMEQSLQAARMLLWTTLPICHVRTLGLLYWQLHGYREWALQEPSNLAFTLMLRDILTDALFCRGVEARRQSNKSIPENFTQLGVGKLLAPLSGFLSFFQKTLNSGNVSHRLYSSMSYFLRLMRVLEGRSPGLWEGRDSYSQGCGQLYQGHFPWHRNAGEELLCLKSQKVGQLSPPQLCQEALSCCGPPREWLR